MNLSQLTLTLLLAAVVATSTNAVAAAAKQAHEEVEVLVMRDKKQRTTSNNHHHRKLRNHHHQKQKMMRKLNGSRAMSIPNTDMPISPRIVTDSPTPSPDNTDQPTNEPTPSPTGSDCDNIGDVKEIRSGVQYDLRFAGDQSCRDADGNRYEYGEIDNVDNFDDCAETCVQDVPASILSHFRGIDFVCQNQGPGSSVRGEDGKLLVKSGDSCRCLFDAGTLESNSRSVMTDGVFDSTNTDGAGKGTVGHGSRRANSKFQRVGTTEDKEVVCVELESTTVLADVAAIA